MLPGSWPARQISPAWCGRYKGARRLIDPRSIIDPDAQLGNGVTVGPWTSIGAGVRIGDHCWIASHVILKGPMTLGANSKVYQFATIGEDTPALAYKGEASTLVIGTHNTIREGVTIHRGMAAGCGRTSIGNHNLFMAYAHIGHDCQVGNHVIMANNASISGHVCVGDHANFGGYSGVPQHRNIGAHSHIAGMSLVLKDVPAFMTVAGNPARAIGLNREGIRRRGLDAQALEDLREAHRVVYRSGLRVTEAVAQLRGLAQRSESVGLFVRSVEASKLGIIRSRTRVTA